MSTNNSNSKTMANSNNVVMDYIELTKAKQVDLYNQFKDVVEWTINGDKTYGQIWDFITNLYQEQNFPLVDDYGSRIYITYQCISIRLLTCVGGLEYTIKSDGYENLSQSSSSSNVSIEEKFLAVEQERVFVEIAKKVKGFLNEPQLTTKEKLALTPEQTVAFDELAQAISKCKALGICLMCDNESNNIWGFNESDYTMVSSGDITMVSSDDDDNEDGELFNDIVTDSISNAICCWIDLSVTKWVLEKNE